MKFVLVRPNWYPRWLIMPPMGFMYMKAAARETGLDCLIHDSWLKNETAKQAARGVCDAVGDGDIVGVQVFQDTVDWIRDFIRNVKLRSRAKIAAGGPYITALGDNARAEVGADIGVRREADSDIGLMMRQIMENDSLVTFSMPFADVNRIPIPAWDSIQLSDYWPYLYQVSMPTKGKRIGIVQRSRGCPFHCTYCSSGVTMGHRVRIWDDANVMDEIGYLRERWGMDELWFADDNTIVDYRRGIELFGKLASLNLHIRLPLGVRWENVDDQMAKVMHDAGVYFTGIGVESGNPRVLKRINKSLDQARTRDAIRLLHSHGVTTIRFFILGLPTETREEMKDTVRWALRTKLDHAQFGTFIPYPGSEDYRERSLLPHGELVKIQRNATLRFYLRPRIVWGLIRHFQQSQLGAMWRHPWVKAWRECTNEIKDGKGAANV